MGQGGYLIIALLILIKSISSIAGYQEGRKELQWGVEFFQKKTMSWQAFNGYIKFAAINGVFFTCYTALMMTSLTWMVRSVHMGMMFGLLHSKIAEFIQRTPAGIILNRVSYDINTLDLDYSTSLNASVPFFISVFTDMYKFLVGIESYTAFIPVAVYIFLSVLMRNWYLYAMREITRLSAITKSPVIGIASSTIEGGVVIRTLKKQRYFSKKLEEKINENTKNGLMSLGIGSWFSVMMTVWDVLCLSTPLYALVIYYLYTNYDPEASENQKSKQVDLSNFILGAIGFASNFFITLSYTCDLELSLVSAERCNQFEKLESEVGYKTIEKDKAIFNNLDTRLEEAERVLELDFASRKQIFENGRIEIEEVDARYPTSKKDVLHDINLNIEAGQKVGIVGRTGAGKSSFTKLLWRALNPKSGRIYFDSIDIKTLDLKTLRHQLNIILQKPTIFEGTIASNLSPFRMTDAKVSQLTRRLQDLGFPENKLADGLEYKVEAGGSNLSQSEKQILSLVQALEKESKIVILDEATAYLDKSMEKKFQEQVFEKFAESTILVIAHRISNVLNCDRILVFDDGKIVEDGTVSELLALGEGGVFYQIWSKR